MKFYVASCTVCHNWGEKNSELDVVKGVLSLEILLLRKERQEMLNIFLIVK